eukprot:Awhi_evm1s9351
MTNQPEEPVQTEAEIAAALKEIEELEAMMTKMEEGAETLNVKLKQELKEMREANKPEGQ